MNAVNIWQKVDKLCVHKIGLTSFCQLDRDLLMFNSQRPAKPSVNHVHIQPSRGWKALDLRELWN